MLLGEGLLIPLAVFFGGGDFEGFVITSADLYA